MPAQKSNVPEVRREMPAPFQQLLTRMELEGSSDDATFVSPMLTSMLKIMEATDVDEMWESDELDQTGGRDLVDTELRILEYAVKFSTNVDIESEFIDSRGRKMYLLIRSARLDNGEEFVWNTSAPLLVGKIFWLTDHNMLPMDAVIRGTELGGGKTVLKLKPIPKRAVPSSEAPF
jgi:hypothetical protein